MLIYLLKPCLEQLKVYFWRSGQKTKLKECMAICQSLIKIMVSLVKIWIMLSKILFKRAISWKLLLKVLNLSTQVKLSANYKICPISTTSRYITIISTSWQNLMNEELRSFSRSVSREENFSIWFRKEKRRKSYRRGIWKTWSRIYYSELSYIYLK